MKGIRLTETRAIVLFRSKGQLGHGENRNENFPRLNKEMRKIKREVHQVACGNNCTVLLVGKFRVPTLQELCVDTIAQSGDRYQYKGTCTLLDAP